MEDKYWHRYLDPKSWHETAAYFPLMSNEETEDLAEDIRQNGLTQPITLLGNKILDGRNRLRACAITGVDPQFIQWKPNKTNSPLAWVVSQNVMRRNLTPTQKAIMAANMVPAFREEAKKRRLSPLKRGTKPPLVRESPPEQESIPEVTLADPPTSQEERGKAVEQAAKILGVNPRYVQDILSIREKFPELVEQMWENKVTLSKAKKELNMSRERITLVIDPSEIEEREVLEYWRKIPKDKRSRKFLEMLHKSLTGKLLDQTAPRPDFQPDMETERPSGPEPFSAQSNGSEHMTDEQAEALAQELVETTWNLSLKKE